MANYYISQVLVDIDGVSWSFKIESPKSMEHSRYLGYLEAFEEGYKPEPLREKWWQIFRPSEYEPALLKAISDNGDAAARLQEGK
jgi:hypothetical protein